MNQQPTMQVADLVRDHGRMVYTTAYRILGNAEDAEDAYQDVFLKLVSGWTGRLKPRGVRDWGAFLRVTAARKAVDLLRRNRSRNQGKASLMRETQSEMDCPAASGSPEPSNPRQAAIQRQHAELLREAVRNLPKREARVFVMRHFEDFPYEQIAEHLGMNSNTVGVVLHRAKERLRKFLETRIPMEGVLESARQSAEPMELESRHVEQ